MYLIIFNINLSILVIFTLLSFQTLISACKGFAFQVNLTDNCSIS